ncbi:EI24 domain-containing protein [Streptomyces sp. NPDC005438]|uniref:EI24 domain-containing protein n=1 Tax=Streptomyces sp. NPDC005438 TaxID=3156880 RepID=UPI00339E31F3
MRELASGVRYLGRGHRWVAENRRSYGFALLPGVISLVLYGMALVALVLWVDDLAVWATPFADDWGPGTRMGLRGLVIALTVVLALTLTVLTFTAVTLLIGDPFYEALSERVEESEGDCPEGPDRPLWRELWISLRDSVHVLLRALVFTVPLFFLGFVPVIGQTVVPVLTVCVSGYFLTVELTSVAMQRRDIPVRERLALVRRHRSVAVSFGVPLVLGFLVPLLAVFLMPGAVAGATLLVRDLTAEEEPEPEPAAEPDLFRKR